MKNIIFLSLLCLWFHPACATLITYDVSHIGGNTWEYTYSVTNDTLTFDIDEFSISFDLGRYEDLRVTSTPSNWDPLVFQPDPALPDDGLYDVLALVSGIAPGDTLGGFSVQFNYLDSGAPGSQLFDIIDPNTFVVVDSGVTATKQNTVPEPSLLWLLVMGIAMLVITRIQSTNLPLRKR